MANSSLHSGEEPATWRAMSLLHAIILGIVEGLSEYLPVSSTGHLILTGHLLGIKGEGSEAFDIVIQLGAILAVVVHYRSLLKERVNGLLRKDPDAIRLAMALMSAFIPTAVVGLLLRKTIKRFLFGPKPVAIALVVGGILMLVMGAVRAKRKSDETALQSLTDVTPKRGFLIGLGQCFALCPGASRSMCTIVAGQLTGLSTAVSAEFSFLLALPTLGAATAYEMLKSWHALTSAEGSLAALVVGMVVSFFVAWGVMAAFLGFLKRRGLAAFGAYRIVVGILVFLVLAKA